MKRCVLWSKYPKHGIRLKHIYIYIFTLSSNLVQPPLKYRNQRPEKSPIFEPWVSSFSDPLLAVLLGGYSVEQCWIIWYRYWYVLTCILTYIDPNSCFVSSGNSRNLKDQLKISQKFNESLNKSRWTIDVRLCTTAKKKHGWTILLVSKKTHTSWSFSLSLLLSAL